MDTPLDGQDQDDVSANANAAAAGISEGRGRGSTTDAHAKMTIDESRTDWPGIPEGRGSTADAHAKIPIDESRTDWLGEQTHEDNKSRTPGRLARGWAKLGLDIPTVSTMLKGSLAPTIGIAMYQSQVVADYYITQGFLIAIGACLAIPILPRAKFWQGLVLLTFSFCVASAFTLLAMWSSIQARKHTSPPPASAAAAAVYSYNSSQSAVLGVWLFFLVYAANTVRAKLPVFNLPMIGFCIVVNIGLTYGAFQTTTEGVEILIRRLLVSLLTGLGLAAAVNVLVFPLSCRQVVFKQFVGAADLIRKLVTQQRAYLAALESEDMFAAATRATEAEKGGRKSPAGANNNTAMQQTREAKAAKALNQTTGALRALLGQLQANMPFAKREIAYGKLECSDLSTMFKLLRAILIPTVSISSIAEIFKRVSTSRGWDQIDEDDMSAREVLTRQLEKRVWNDVMRQMHEPFAILSEALDQALLHVCICLEIVPRPISKNPDIEARGDEVRPGDVGFARVVEGKVAAFHARKTELIRAWAAERVRTDEEEERLLATLEMEGDEGNGSDDDEDGNNNNNNSNSNGGSRSRSFVADAFERGLERCERNQAQLYVVLYLESLMQAAGDAAIALVRFGNRKVVDGTMARRRLIVPTARRLRKWARLIFRGVGDGDGGSATAVDGEQAPDLADAGGGSSVFWVGDGFNRKKDPERLPPETGWQRFGERVRSVPRFLASEQSSFGFRTACATMTVGVVAYLRETQVFFMNNRLVWAMIMVSIAMTLTSGQSTFGFILRIGGTLVATISSIIIWYIVDQKPAGVIVFLWLFILLDFYLFLKYPRFIQAILIVMITQIVVIGYELQVVKLGVAVATKTGQPAYPTYELAPYRLATVAGGCFVAFIWTILPYPLSERTWLRRDLSATFYVMSNYLSVVNSVMHGLAQKTVDPTKFGVPGTPANKLLKVRLKLFGQAMILLSSMAQHTAWQRWEPAIGGRFPRAQYEAITQRATRILTFLMLMGFTLMLPPPPRDGVKGRAHPDADTAESNPEWDAALAEVAGVLEPVHHNLLATLTMLSNALMAGQSLPPYIPVPCSRDISQSVREAGQRGLKRLSRQQHRARRDRHGPGGGDDDDDDDDEEEDENGRLLPYVPALLEVRTGAKSAKLYDNMMNKSRSRGRRGVSSHSRMGGDIRELDAGELERAGVASFAILSVCISLVSEDLEHLVHDVAGLVGVVDYSFEVAGPNSESGSSTNVVQS